MTINELITESYRIATEHGWHEPGKEATFIEQCTLFHCEISEAVEEYRKGRKVNECVSVDGKPEGVPYELADVFIRIADACGRYGIDLETAIRIKMSYNKNRPHRHGKVI